MRRRNPVTPLKGVSQLTYVSVCPECEKTFERVSGDWGYIFSDKKYCTYSCMRAAERKSEARRKKK